MLNFLFNLRSSKLLSVLYHKDFQGTQLFPDSSFRFRVIHRLENLKFLDSRQIDADERDESRRLGVVSLTHHVLTRTNDRNAADADAKVVGARRQNSNPADFQV